MPLTAAQLTDGPWCGQSPGRFDADLLSVRRVGVTLRLEAEGTEFRGAGAAFANQGTSLDAERYVPTCRSRSTSRLATFSIRGCDDDECPHEPRTVVRRSSAS